MKLKFIIVSVLAMAVFSCNNESSNTGTNADSMTGVSPADNTGGQGTPGGSSTMGADTMSGGSSDTSMHNMSHGMQDSTGMNMPRRDSMQK